MLGWTQRELETRSGVTQKTIADFERGARTPLPRTLRDIVEAIEGAGVHIVQPQEGVNGEGVMLAWGVEPALRQGGEDDGDIQRGGRTTRAMPDDADLRGLFDYWRQHSEEWRALSEPSRGAVLTEIFGSIPDVDPIAHGIS